VEKEKHWKRKNKNVAHSTKRVKTKKQRSDCPLGGPPHAQWKKKNTGKEKTRM
jgi:hypothetical protein